ncbi:hypothetical protein ACFXHA_05255 [Nocardia sp. NPDC059240]|uniref:hypothetical protein n=1 Tax=Nocardia sp. NPDC059240 TaxID=3346786 RepID=UPI00369654AD
MSTDVLGVHGIWNYRDATATDAETALTQRWADALAMESVAVAYYADHLRLGYHGPGDDLGALDGALDGMPRQLLEAWIAELGWEGGAAQGRALVPLRQLMSWFVTRCGADRAIVLPFVSEFLEEVAVYLDPRDPSKRQAVQSIVARAIHQHQPRIVVAHSLGSVVTYETLWAYPRLAVELLVTIGSPLAMPNAIFPLLQPAPVNGIGARPPGVQRWVNIADPSDIVAIPRPLRNRFDGIDEDLERPVGWWFTHAASAYLSSRDLRDIIGGHLQSPRRH